MAEAFVKFSRKICKWEWYKNAETFKVFVHLILTANYADGRFEGIEVKRGQRVTSFKKLAEETGLSIRQVRTAVEHLKSTREVTHKAYPKFSLFTVVNYDKYQSNRHDERQASDTQATCNRHQYKNNKNKKNNIYNAHAREGSLLESDNLSSDKSAAQGSYDEQAVNSLFDLFFENYPNKQCRSRALSEFKKLSPDKETVDAMTASVEIWKQSEQWQDATFIPQAANFIKNRRWEDTPPPARRPARGYEGYPRL